jgi:hypothetical protein
MAELKSSEGFNFDGDLIRINSGDGRPKNFVTPDDYIPDDSFLEIGPQAVF